MRFEEYNKRIAQIFTRLAELAKVTAQAALAGTANPRNQRFVRAMGNHARLVQKAQELNNEMLAQLMKDASRKNKKDR